MHAEPGSYVQDIDSDRVGNVIVPLPGGLGVEVYSGASMCGPSLGMIGDTSEPISAASLDAATFVRSGCSSGLRRSSARCSR